MSDRGQQVGSNPKLAHSFCGILLPYHHEEDQSEVILEFFSLSFGVIHGIMGSVG